MKHWLGILGQSAKEKLLDLNRTGEIDLNRAKQFYEDNWALSVEETIRRFVPLNPIWYENGRDKIGLAIHGVIFPRERGIDDLFDNPSDYFKTIIKKHKNNFRRLPLEFYNGVFVGLILKPRENEYYLFNSFLNHIPLYYFKNNNNIYFSTNISLLSKCLTNGSSLNDNGILEYLENGTNISDNTIIRGVYCLTKSSILGYRKKKLTTSHYYVFPSEATILRKAKLVDKSHALWQEGIRKLYSKRINFGLGLTGGVDSRLIYAEWQNKHNLITFTGTHSGHPDYVIAHMLTQKVGYEKEHVLEDYSNFSRETLIESFIEYLKLLDNPLTLNDIAIKKQIEWRKNHNIEVQLHGLGGEILGGELYYFSKSSFSGLMKLVMPFKYNKMRLRTKEFYKVLIKLGLHNFVGNSLFGYFKGDHYIDDYNEFMYDFIVNSLNNYINTADYCENYLERFRAIYKHPNLLYYRFLAAREFYEFMSPYFSIDFVDFLMRIPLHFRNDRKLTLNIMRTYYPQVSNVILSGSIFAPDCPFWLYKVSKPFTKGLNAMRIKIPYLQPRTTRMAYKYDPLDFYLDHKIKKFMATVISTSDIINDKVQHELTKFCSLDKLDYNNFRGCWEKIRRLFCLTLAEKRFSLKYKEYCQYIDNTWNYVKDRTNSG